MAAARKETWRDDVDKVIGRIHHPVAALFLVAGLALNVGTLIRMEWTLQGSPGTFAAPQMPEGVDEATALAVQLISTAANSDSETLFALARTMVHRDGAFAGQTLGALCELAHLVTAHADSIMTEDGMLLHLGGGCDVSDPS